MAGFTLRYRAGDWFAVPLESRGYAVGRIARRSRGPVALAYFFGPRHPDPPSADQLRDLAPRDAVLVCRFGDPGLRGGEWPLLGTGVADYHPEEWPMPAFGRTDDITGAGWVVQYPDDDPNGVPRESVVPLEQAERLPRDALHGWGVVESLLDDLLD